MNYSRRQALDHRIIKIRTQKKPLFNLCVFSATPLLPSIVDSENHIFLAVLGRRGLETGSRSPSVRARGRLRPHERRRLELAPAGLAPSPPHPRPSARLGNPHQYARPAMRPQARGSHATASASPDRVSVVIDDWLKSFSAFGLGQELVGHDADCCQSNVRRGQITKNGSGKFSIADLLCRVLFRSKRVGWVARRSSRMSA